MVSKEEIERIIRERVGGFQAEVTEGEKILSVVDVLPEHLHRRESLDETILRVKVRLMKDKIIEDREIAKALGIEIDKPMDKTV